MPRVGFGNLSTFSVVELWVPSSGTPTQWVPNRSLCLRILNQTNSTLNFMDGNSITDAFTDVFQASNKLVGGWKKWYVQTTSFYIPTFENSQLGKWSTFGEICQWLISEASQSNNLSKSYVSFFTTTVIFVKNKVKKPKTL